MKPQLSHNWQQLRFASAITLLATSLVISLALWAPDHKNGISPWWAIVAIASAVQASLMMRAHFAETDI
ncbi:hypothetical protein [uncultured Actinomyces sp.]|uniref:hypothetical protein n=1 Tax=uncultured Actinomyces sp. TaxID=249061 RepID=UPI0020559560|nr:hypothetical protein [uncultured Actinomyces sp.]DAZ10749.1 MAG TPA: hypothetical protein [Caudoviricetes sp.]